MRWIDVIIALRNKQESVACPFRGSKNVSYKETVINQFDDAGFVDV